MRYVFHQSSLLANFMEYGGKRNLGRLPWCWCLKFVFSDRMCSEAEEKINLHNQNLKFRFELCLDFRFM